MKILVIEDEPEIREDIVQSLEQEHYLVETAVDYASASEKIGVYEYDCILLDLGLPGGNGLDFLKELKDAGLNVGVIIVSARDSIHDKVKGLDLGADDYLPKPFHMAELHARIKSLIRRKTLGGSPILEINNVKIDTDYRIVTVDGEELKLNRKEFDVLIYMVTNKNKLVLKTALAEHVWGDYIDEMNSYDFIYSQIKNLRKKLNDKNAGIEIQAVYGLGYKLTDS
jgi:DNA-binding response OmpR family regulator